MLCWPHRLPGITDSSQLKVEGWDSSSLGECYYIYIYIYRETLANSHMQEEHNHACSFSHTGHTALACLHERITANRYTASTIKLN